MLWKANWTRDAEKILKAFEKDVILKVTLSMFDVFKLKFNPGYLVTR